MPSVPWRVEFSKIFQKKRFSKFQKCPKVFPKVSKRVLNMFWGKFFEKFYAQCSMEGRVFENFQKTQIICKIPKMHKVVPKCIQTCFELFLGQFFRKIFLPSVPWNVESSKIFEKNIFKFPKLPKSVPKSIQTCFRVIFSKKFYAQCSMEGRVFEKFQIFFSKFQKCPKSFPKASKRVLNVFWGKFFENFFAQCSVEGRVFENFSEKNIFKIPKMPESVPKSIQTCFEHVLGNIFRKILCPVFHGGSSLRKFSYKSKNSQNSKMPKIVPKSIQTCFENVLGQTFRKNFAQFSMECRVFENFQKKNKKIAKFQKCPKSFPKVSKRVLNLFWVKFFEKLFCPVFRGGSSLRKFSKKNIFKIPKMPKSVPKTIQTCLRVIFFEKKIMPGVPWRVEFSKNFKFFFQNSKNVQNRSRKHPNVF